jgi:type II secretory pathway pseudopilin PulG
MIKRRSNFKSGFTVLESIVAIFILSLSVSGVFSAIQQSLSQNTLAKDEIKAFYLAQEAVEVLRNKRDSNQISIIDTNVGHWLAGIAENLSDPCYFDKVCRADARDLSLVSCGTKSSGATCPNLKQDSSTFLYGYSSGSDTVFRREMTLDQINQNEIAITVNVYWTKGIFQKSFSAKTHLLNWVKPI